MFFIILAQTLTHSFRKGGGALGACAFYIITVTLFTFALGAEAMRDHAGAVMAVSMLLASLVALPLLFERDYEDGTLEQYLLMPGLLELIALAKLCGHWLAVALPILAISPVIALLCNLENTKDILLLLLLASPSMVAIGAVGAALTLGIRRGGLLQALIILPLYIPILIFAANGGQGAILILTALLLAGVPLACWVTAALIRLND